MTSWSYSLNKDFFKKHFKILLQLLIITTICKNSSSHPSLTCVVVKVDPPSHCVDHRLWLLEDLLLHEGIEVACRRGITSQGNIPSSTKKQILLRTGSWPFFFLKSVNPEEVVRERGLVDSSGTWNLETTGAQKLLQCFSENEGKQRDALQRCLI